MAFILRSSADIAVTYATMAAHVLALTAAILMLVWVLHYGGGVNLHSDNPDLVFNVHPLVMCLGFIIFIGEGVMAYKTVRMTKKVQKFIHMMLQLVALTLGILGVYAAFKYHKESGAPDMDSLHSWLGMCTICLFGLQWLFGFFFFWFPGAPSPTRQTISPLHASAGLAIFLMTICTAETGLMQKSGPPGSETRVINFTGLLLLLFGIAVSIAIGLPRAFASL